MTPDWLRYSNAGATRNWPLDPRLVNALSFLGNMGVTMDVFSGGQPATGPHRTGSHRHDFGGAADAMFYKDGRPLMWENPQDRPLFQSIVQQARANGVTGFGAGEGYMRPGSMHIGFGTPAVWGAGGAGANAPQWLRTAAGGGGPVTSPPTASAAMMFDKTPIAQTPGMTGTFQPLLGDVVAPQTVQAQLMTPPSMGSLALTFLQQAEERRQREQDQEQARREALFTPPVIALNSGVAGLYG